MTDYPALLAAVIAHPEEDMPRLALADWFQENGQEDRAEFVRVQIELARLGEPRCRRMIPLQFADGQIDYVAGTSCGECENCVKAMGFLKRERDLLDPPSHHRPGMYGEPHYNWFVKDLQWTHRHELSRGFVSHVTCTWESWKDHADAITAAHPIEKVTLTTWPDWAAWSSARGEWIEFHGGRRAVDVLAAEWNKIEFDILLDESRFTLRRHRMHSAIRIPDELLREIDAGEMTILFGDPAAPAPQGVIHANPRRRRPR